ncbi:MAG: hypothetical protein ACPGSB_07355 [Opitutales bacterium]
MMTTAAAWPAGLVYYEAEKGVYAEQIEVLDGSSEDRQRWNELLERIEDPEDSEAFDELWKVFNSKSVEPTVDIITEYNIYIGVCAVWGAIVGLAVSAGHFVRKGL